VSIPVKRYGTRSEVRGPLHAVHVVHAPAGNARADHAGTRSVALRVLPPELEAGVDHLHCEGGRHLVLVLQVLVDFIVPAVLPVDQDTRLIVRRGKINRAAQGKKQDDD